MTYEWGNIKVSWFLAAVSILVCIGYNMYFVNKAHVTLDIQVQKRTFFKIYWAEAGKGFSEKNHVQVMVDPGQTHYEFYLTNLDGIERLRIDPHEYTGESSVRKIELRQRGFQDVYLHTRDDFVRLIPLMHVEEYGYDGGGLGVKSSGNDPAFQYDLHAERAPFGWSGWISRSILLFIGTYVAGTFVAPLLFEYRFVPLLLAIAFTLAAVMAGMSKRNVHPDEYIHIAAAEYYMDNWLPPRVDDERIRHTYSPYGFSRLNTQEAYYFFVGKFAGLFSEVNVEHYTLFRMFGVLLLLAILLITVKYGEARLVALPLLLSPQIWYVFSYCNSDAFCLFIAFIAGWQLIGDKTLLKKCLLDKYNLKTACYSFSAGAYLCLILLLKKNYYPFVVFIFGYLFFYCWINRKEFPLKQVSVRVVGLCLIAFSLLLVRMGTDYQINGLDRMRKWLQ